MLFSCAAPPEVPPRITDPDAVADHEGQLVTLRGVLRSVKGTTLLGVGVHGEPDHMHGALVEATGVLQRRSVSSPGSVWDSRATRYGTFFTLQEPRTPTRLARVAVVGPATLQPSRSRQP
jgi:hypothetical protein